MQKTKNVGLQKKEVFNTKRALKFPESFIREKGGKLDQSRSRAEFVELSKSCMWPELDLAHKC